MTVLSLLVVTGIGLAIAVVFDVQEEETLRLAAVAELALEEAIGEAEAAATGTAIQGSLSMQHARPVYVIQVIGDRGTLRSVTVDAVTGGVIAVRDQ